MNNPIKFATQTAINAQKQATSIETKIDNIFNKTIVPDVDGEFNIGSESLRWNNLFIGSDATIEGFVITNIITTQSNSNTSLDLIPDGVGITRIFSPMTARTNIVNSSETFRTYAIQSGSVFILTDIVDPITISMASTSQATIANGTLLKFLFTDQIRDDTIITFNQYTENNKFRGKINSISSSPIYISTNGVSTIAINSSGVKDGDTIEMLYVGDNKWYVTGHLYDASYIQFT